MSSFSVSDGIALAQLLPGVLEELRTIVGDLRKHSSTPEVDLSSIKTFLASLSSDIEDIHGTVKATAQKVTDMALDLTQLQGSVSNVQKGVNRAISELRDLAGKLQNTDDQAAVNAVASKLQESADALNSVVTEVDTDQSSPQS